MNLLVLSTWFPFPPDNGSRLRAWHLLRELSKRHRIRLVAGVQNDVADADPAPLRALCDDLVAVPWHWYSPATRGAAGALRALISSTPRSIKETENPELRAAIAAQLARPTDAVLVLQMGMAPFLPGTISNNVPLVLDEAEVSGLEQTRRAARGARAQLRHALTQRKSERYWRHALQRFASVTAASEQEAHAVRAVLGGPGAPPPVAVVPNGVDTTAYQRAPGRAIPGRLLYNGALTYGPNRDAVCWFARDILPLVAARVGEAHLVVTGGIPSGEANVDALRSNPRVCLPGFVPDLRPVLDEAALCVVPLLSGGGTRLKVLEAWAASLPVVSTSVGVAGLDARSDVHFVVADAPVAFAEATIRLLQNPTEASALAVHARRLVEEQYDWARCAALLNDVLEGV